MSRRVEQRGSVQDDNGERREPPYSINLALAGIAIMIAGLQFAVVPLFLLPHAYAAASALVLLAALATPLHAVLLHEAIHGRLMSHPAENHLAGRTLAVAFGVSYEVVRFGHLLHHGYNRHALDRPDVIEPGTSRLRAWAGYYIHLLGGVYAGEIAASIVFLLPRPAVRRLVERNFPDAEPASAAVRKAVLKVVDDPRRVRRIRMDAIASVLLHGAAFWLYGAYCPLLLAGVAARGVVVSLMDNAAHYGTPAIINTPARNMSAPRWLQAFLLNQNYHALHHDRPDLPWTALKPAFARSSSGFDGSYPAAILQQFLGPIRRERLPGGRAEWPPSDEPAGIVAASGGHPTEGR
jgi:fatty acid desaturase